jgi:hypothetical protein
MFDRHCGHPPILSAESRGRHGDLGLLFFIDADVRLAEHVSCGDSLPRGRVRRELDAVNTDIDWMLSSEEVHAKLDSTKQCHYTKLCSAIVKSQ